MKTLLFVSALALAAAACGHSNGSNGIDSASSVKDAEADGNQPTPDSLDCSGSEDGVTDPAFASLVVAYRTDGTDGPRAELTHMVSGVAGPVAASRETYPCTSKDNGLTYSCQNQAETDHGEAVRLQYIPLAGHNVARIYKKSFVGTKQTAVLTCDQ